ncbi:MAG: hypothetical protein HETSPECPRED_001464 [Heterodermia speciosa]|uniref:MARVEL domain-containing protein n=1 Tax=Heterodermia speciosa TaxID=116794 RepID=A0A8H3J1M5_9LECA|nr:MAG: hypothetical protein HETSPECPRED_001464 [Heterodermia speciosa]
MPEIINLALRGAQIFFGILILGLSGHLVASQRYGGAPATTNYEVFVGILCLLVALIGVAASFISAIGGVILFALDALTCLFLFAGGVAFAARIPLHCGCNQPHSQCTHLTNNNIVNGGVTTVDGHHVVDPNVNRVDRCRQAQADTAFIWFAWAAFVATALFSFLAWRRGGIK